MKEYGGLELWFQLFLISMLDKMSGQPYAPAALLSLPIEETGWAPKPVWISGEEIKHLRWPGIESRIFQPVGHSVC
jgi:hypothetical protein